MHCVEGRGSLRSFLHSSKSLIIREWLNWIMFLLSCSRTPRHRRNLKTVLKINICTVRMRMYDFFKSCEYTSHISPSRGTVVILLALLIFSKNITFSNSPNSTRKPSYCTKIKMESVVSILLTIGIGLLPMSWKEYFFSFFFDLVGFSSFGGQCLCVDGRSGVIPDGRFHFVFPAAK